MISVDVSQIRVVGDEAMSLRGRCLGAKSMQPLHLGSQGIDLPQSVIKLVLGI
jgi:hypothetical protein